MSYSKVVDEQGQLNYIIYTSSGKHRVTVILDYINDKTGVIAYIIDGKTIYETKEP